MSNRTIGILFFVFILLGSYVYFFEIKKTEDADKTPKVEKLLNINVEKVVGLAVTRKKDRIVFQKESDQWFITEPVKAKARKDRVEDLLSLFDFGVVREITTDLSDASKYGLDHPEVEFAIKFEDEKVPQTLLLGEDSPGSFCCYGRLKSQSRIVLLGVLYKRELERSLDSFIDQSESPGNAP